MNENDHLSASELTAEIRPLMDKLQIPGVAVGVVGGRLETVAVLGVTSIDNPLPVTSSTLFQLGSITKTYTATALMRMVERGRLDLNAPIRQYLPEFSLANEAWANSVTARQLLTHTGGWEGDYLLSKPVGGRGDDALRRVVADMPGAPLLTRPGTVYAYSNVGFSVAGRLLEVIAGETYEDALGALVLQPLGLDQTCLLPEQILNHRFAIGHTHTSATDIDVATWWAHRSFSASGAVVSSLHDVVEYLRFHMAQRSDQHPETVLQLETIESMQQPHFLVGDHPEAVGLSWMLNGDGDDTVVSHTGSSNGQFAMIQIVPKHDLAVAVLTNADTGLILARHVARWVNQRVAAITESEPDSIEVSRRALNEYVGTYTGELFSLDVEPDEPPGQLKANIRFTNPIKGWEASAELPPVSFTFYRKDVGIVRDGFFETVQPRFLRAEHGNIEWLRFNERLHRRVEAR